MFALRFKLNLRVIWTFNQVISLNVEIVVQLFDFSWFHLQIGSSSRDTLARVIAKAQEFGFNCSD